MHAQLDSYVGWYQLSPSRVLTVTRDGERLLCPGDRTAEIRGQRATAPMRFPATMTTSSIFLRDGQAKVTQVLLQDPLSGARLAPRVGVARAKAIEEEFARRIAEVPDRFREQAPLPGSKEAILRGIEDLQPRRSEL